MNLNEIMKDALEEYEYYYDGFEEDDSETVLETLADSLQTKDYQNCPYLNNALRVYYQLTTNNYNESNSQTANQTYQTILNLIKKYFKDQQIQL